MSAGRYDIKIEQGATFSLPITVQDSSGSVIDLTGATPRGQLRLNYASPRALATFAVSGSMSLGTFTCSLTPETTAALPAGNAVYDVEIAYSATSVDRLLEGTVTISPEVTRV
jgi:hypothetical protein